MPALCHEFDKLRGLNAEKSLLGLEWLHAQPALYGNYMTSDGACIMFTPASPKKTIACVKAFGLMPRAVPKVLFYTFKGVFTGQGAFVSSLSLWTACVCAASLFALINHTSVVVYVCRMGSSMA